MTDRTERLRQHLFDTEPRICPERCVYFTESMKRTEGRPIALRRSEAFYDVLGQMTVYVNKDELIVGNQARWPKASPVYPEYSTEWLEAELNGAPFYPDQRPGDKFWSVFHIGKGSPCMKTSGKRSPSRSTRHGMPM